MGSMLGITDLVNISTFLCLGFSSYIIFYLTQKANPQKQVSWSVFVFTLGLNLIGLSHLFRLGSEQTISPFIGLSLILGSIFTTTGIIFTFSKRPENLDYEKRRKEIKDVIDNLKKKYYKQEISEEELKSIHSNLLKELAEIEVKLESTKKKNKDIEERSEEEMEENA